MRVHCYIFSLFFCLVTATAHGDDTPAPRNPHGTWEYSYLKTTNPDGSYKKKWTWNQSHPDVTGLAQNPAKAHLRDIWDDFQKLLSKSDKYKNLKLSKDDLAAAWNAIDNAHGTSPDSLSAGSTAVTKWSRDKNGKLTLHILISQKILDERQFEDPYIIELLVHEGLHAAMDSAGDTSDGSGKSQDQQIYPFNNEHLYPGANPVELGKDGLPK